ncbi:cytochrome P450 [Lindgomyces ingoldianus]|uniref:Cytochrome P450 n=1 Tax=Lindgomyces ingoldianus TaxID=673940 RepID=A0ACB6R804_9PLEO|nr:cytochrome P450 [Lindgomyces ingoldianus]KAF2475217.1 cytochrome P450 [Lindgomyces ingoldianus]
MINMLQDLVQELHQPSVVFGLVCGLLYILSVCKDRPQFQKVISTSRIWTTVLNKYLAYKYLLNGASMIEEQYAQSNGQPFVIRTPEKMNIMVTSSAHIQEIDKAPRHQLSLHAVAKEFLQPKNTMNGFEWKDQRGIEGTGFVRAIRNLLTARLPELIPRLSTVIEDQIQAEVTQAKQTKDGWGRIPLFAAAKHIVTRTNCAVFFPAELSSNPEFVQAALEFPEDVFFAAEIIRILPRGIAPFLAKLATKNHKSTTVMYNFLYPVVQKRMELSCLAPELRGEEEPNDGVQWLINTTPKRESWSTSRLVGEIMAVWYGSLHTLAIATTYALVDLYSRPEYIKSLRAELSSSMFFQFQSTSEGLPEMDSFLKESARLSAFESTGVRRQALEDFRFSDGLLVPKGSWVCVPHRAMMRDDRHFPEADRFDGRRFLPRLPTPEALEASRLSQRSNEWLVWGAGRITCPGRFYAVVVLKLVLANMLQNYDAELEPIKGSRSAQWRTALIPRAGITLKVKPRQI